MSQAPSPRIIGLTGGIGMGKTTVSEYLAKTYQLPILDADLYAREAVEPGTIVLEAIVNRYQSKILLPDGTLDRRQLGAIIFTQPSERSWLLSVGEHGVADGDGDGAHECRTLRDGQQPGRELAPGERADGVGAQAPVDGALGAVDELLKRWAAW